jgi:small subunit ribosomal protein S21
MSKKSEQSNIFISIGDGMPAERALRKFKRLCDAYGIVKEYRKRNEYRKPCVARKEKLEAAEKRRKKNNSKSRSHRKI